MPDTIAVLSHLEELILRKNKLTIFPVSLFNLKGLKYLNLSSNQIGYVPNGIVNCSELTDLDLYNNPIGDLGDGLQELQNLKRLDLRGLMMNAKKQAQISEKIPGVQILFDAPCNCVN